MTNPYPNLGWNPVPGIPTEVQGLKKKVDQAAKALRDSHQQITRLLGQSSHWEGDAASAFRDALDGELPEYMKKAAESIEKASVQLAKWDGDLASNRDLAKKYDEDAKEKQGAADTAQGKYDEARKDPDLGLAGKTFPSQEEADAATARLRSAEGRLRQAAADVEKANQAYNDVIAKAKALEEEHKAEAGKVADQLDVADDGLAPEEPGWLSKTLSAIGDGLKAVGQFLLDHAGTIGAIAGLLALFPTPLAPVFAGIAVVASAAAMSKNLASEDFRDSLMGEHGGMAAFSAWASMVGDTMGMVPGVGALARAGGEVGMLAGLAREGGDVMSLGAKATAFGRETVEAFNFKALDVATDPKTGLLQYGINGANVLANTVSSLETAGVVPDTGAGHNSAEVTKAGAAGFNVPGGIKDLQYGLGELVTGIRL
ncbi:putative T7SS-secreted protein [Streptomyces sp. NPDC127084]|uniref:putative T7SS-secreted protein n=1 Tax=Streptomyces sp. NPDC127084 TaxID=3347133 RepID=UPI0036648604